MTDGMAYYVTVRSSEAATARVGFLAGPFCSPAAALHYVPEARRRALATDPWAHFYLFGTAGTMARPTVVFEDIPHA